MAGSETQQESTLSTGRMGSGAYNIPHLAIWQLNRLFNEMQQLT